MPNIHRQGGKQPAAQMRNKKQLRFGGSMTKFENGKANSGMQNLGLKGLKSITLNVPPKWCTKPIHLFIDPDTAI